MSNRKQRRLDTTVAAVQKRYGPRALRRGNATTTAQVPHVSSGFPALDAITGCRGIPLNAATLLNGQSTSGKLTLAYKTLAAAQRTPRGRTAVHMVAILDLSHNTDPDYLARCGLDLEQMLLIRGQPDLNIAALLVDLVRTRDLRMILLDSLSDLREERRAMRQLQQAAGTLSHDLRQAQCGLLLVDELQPPWQRFARAAGLPTRNDTLLQKASLQIEIRRERWLRDAGRLVGYRAQARITRSRWRHDQPTAPIEIRFNGTVDAQSTW